jgi:hypothetical protein
MRDQKYTARAEYRQQESQRTKESISLTEKFRELKSLTVELAYFSPEGVTRNSQIKYTVNPDHAKSVFRFDCVNDECIRGDLIWRGARQSRGCAASQGHWRNVLPRLAQQGHDRQHPLPQYPAL